MLGCHSNWSTGWLISQPPESGAAAELAASHKEEKYAELDGHYIFEPIAIDTFGVLNISARQLLWDLGRKICEDTAEVRETSFLFQRCSVLMQRFNAILLHNSSHNWQSIYMLINKSSIRIELHCNLVITLMMGAKQKSIIVKWAL